MIWLFRKISNPSVILQSNWYLVVRSSSMDTNRQSYIRNIEIEEVRVVEEFICPAETRNHHSQTDHHRLTHKWGRATFLTQFWDFSRRWRNFRKFYCKIWQHSPLFFRRFVFFCRLILLFYFFFSVSYGDMRSGPKNFFMGGPKSSYVVWWHFFFHFLCQELWLQSEVKRFERYDVLHVWILNPKGTRVPTVQRSGVQRTAAQQIPCILYSMSAWTVESARTHGRTPSNEMRVTAEYM